MLHGTTNVGFGGLRCSVLNRARMAAQGRLRFGSVAAQLLLRIARSFHLSRAPAFGILRTAIEGLSSLSIGSLYHLRSTSGAFREIGFLLYGFFSDVLDMRTPCFLVGVQSAAAQFAGKIAHLIFSELNGCPRSYVVQ